jgi:hypothetical protein
MDIKRLTEEQMAFFDAFGFLHFPGMMADRIDRITEEFGTIWESHGGGHDGKPHDEKQRSCIVPFIDQSEYLSSLLDDPRIAGLFSSILGDDFNYSGSDGNYYVGPTGWHPDGNHAGLTHMKVAFYLDPLTKDTGALRVVPGSHRKGEPYADLVHSNYRGQEPVWDVPADELPCAALETQPGDVVCFNHNALHASFGGSTRRRMFTINCSSRYPESRLSELRDYVAGHARFFVENTYGEAMLRTAGPDRLVHMEQILANQDHLPGLVEQRRKEMSEPSRG